MPTPTQHTEIVVHFATKESINVKVPTGEANEILNIIAESDDDLSMHIKGFITTPLIQGKTIWFRIADVVGIEFTDYDSIEYVVKTNSIKEVAKG